MKYQRMAWIVMALLAMPVGLWSQGTITANAKAVNMADHQLWRMQGNPVGGNQVGGGIGGGIDVNGDGYGEFFVNLAENGRWRWRMYLGGNPPDTIADWEADSVIPLPSYPVIGDFYGDGRKEVGFGKWRYPRPDDITYRRYQLLMYAINPGSIAETPFAAIGDFLCPGQMYATNIDGEAGDELIMSRSCYGLEVWFYQGGAEFTGIAPTVIVHDSEEVVEPQTYTELGDLDGDGYVDMMTVAGYRGGKKLKFYWGTETSPWTWRQPDRVVTLGTGYPSVTFFPVLADVDGDGVQDMIFQGGVVYRSRGGKDVRSRSFLVDEDADAVISNSGAGYPDHGGYLNDRGKKYEMILMSGGNAGYWFSGGANGPDTTYAAYYRDGWPDETVFGVGQDVGDIDGDGWDDYGAGNPLYLTNHSGVAVIFRGGPDLPSPDSVSGLREVAVEEHRDGLRMWPNPVEEDLTLVWRGDLKRMPSRFEVVNVLGQRVAYGEVEGWRGSAVWRCGDVPPGVYMVRVSDRNGEPITTVSVVKR